MTSLAHFPFEDPFSLVHPLFWPVLIWNIWVFLGWRDEQIAQGRGHWVHHVTLSACGIIRIRASWPPAPDEGFGVFAQAADAILARCEAMPSWFAAQGVIPPFVLKCLPVSDAEVCALLPLPDI